MDLILLRNYIVKGKQSENQLRVQLDTMILRDIVIEGRNISLTRSSKVRMDFVLLREINIKGKKPSLSKKRSTSPAISEKENDMSYSSRNYQNAKFGKDFEANYPSNSRQLKDTIIWPLSEKINTEEIPIVPHFNIIESNNTKSVELIRDLENQIRQRDQEIKNLNKLVLEQHNELKLYEGIPLDKSHDITIQNLSEENVGDLSIDTEDLNCNDPSKFTKMIRSLRQEEHLLNQKLIVMREDLEDLNKQKSLILEEKMAIISNKSTDSKDINENKKKRKPSGEVIHSESEEDFSNYFILKKKFDEIHIFVTRIAGLLSKSIQHSRRRHVTPELKNSYLKTGSQAIGGLKIWLQNSPSKSQIDKDSKRFYLKFKKRFDTSRSLLIRSDKIFNF